MASATIKTPLTALLGVQHPVMLAGMDQVAGPELAAAVCNAGGFGTLGGARYTPKMLRDMIADMKELLVDKDAPFGVDLLLPQVGGSARKTNYDYTHGSLGELLDVVIDGGAKLFVSAVGVPPSWAIEKLHNAGVLYMNMVGHPKVHLVVQNRRPSPGGAHTQTKHVRKACEAGADLICAQGGEAGGHTGDIPTSVLTPACADVCKQYISPFTQKPVLLVTGGGISDGRSLASALALGASGVWVGTRFIPSKESKYPEAAKTQVVQATYDSWIKSTIWSGRPLRSLRTPYVEDWEVNRQDEIKALTAQGIVPLHHELDRLHKEDKLTEEIEDQAALRPLGIVAGSVNRLGQPAGEIVRELVQGAVESLNACSACVVASAKL